MNPYQGLSLPELMELLHGISMPEPVSMFPQTIGWFILLIWVIAVALLIALHRYKQYKANAYRREALKRLMKIMSGRKTDITTENDTCYAIAVLLKQTALVAYPRTQVASMYGVRWSKFLKRSSNNDAQVCAVADRLVLAAYRKDTKSSDKNDNHTSVQSEMNILFGEAAAQWIKVHRPLNAQEQVFD